MIENPKRFIKEYVTYLLNDLRKYKISETWEREDKITRIYQIYMRGYITADETMRLLVKAAYPGFAED